MNWKSVAIIGVASGTVVTLLATAAPSFDRQSTTSAPPAIDKQQGAALFAETARLRDRVRQPPPPFASTRNPFAFGQAAAGAATDRNSAAEALAVSSSTEMKPLQPPFTLVGLAEDRTSDGVVLTAILSSPGALQFARQGDRLDGGYQVTAVTSDSVALLDGDGRSLLLRLK